MPSQNSLWWKLFRGTNKLPLGGLIPLPPRPPGRLAVTAWWQPGARGQVSQGFPLIQTCWTHKESSPLLGVAFGTPPAGICLTSAVPTCGNTKSGQRKSVPCMGPVPCLCPICPVPSTWNIAPFRTSSLLQVLTSFRSLS